ncbi:MAG: hypothetical protein ABEJ05_03840 [Haloglomus sp.]
MTGECATCGATDVILFTCGDCGRSFCPDHDSPDHSCEGPAHPSEDADGGEFEWVDTEADPFTESGFRPAVDESDSGEARRPVPRSPPELGAATVRPAPRQPGGATTPAVRPAPRGVDADATPAIRPAPRGVDRDTIPSVRPAPRDAAADAPAVGQPASGRATGNADAPADSSTPEPASSTSAPASPPIRTMDAGRPPGRVDSQEPQTLTEWIDQQTYVSLSVKTAALATVINGALYLGMALALYGLVPF